MSISRPPSSSLMMMCGELPMLADMLRVCPLLALALGLEPRWLNDDDDLALGRATSIMLSSASASSSSSESVIRALLNALLDDDGLFGLSRFDLAVGFPAIVGVAVRLVGRVFNVSVCFFVFCGVALLVLGTGVGLNCGVVAENRLPPGTGVETPVKGVRLPGARADFSTFSRASARKCR